MTRLGRLRWLLLPVVLALGCAAATREVVLTERVDDQVDGVPVALGAVEARPIWKNGKRVTLDGATLLVRDPDAGAIRRQKVWVGDTLRIGPVEWTVVAVERGTASARARVVLRCTDCER